MLSWTNFRSKSFINHKMISKTPRLRLVLSFVYVPGDRRFLLGLEVFIVLQGIPEFLSSDG